jgi:ammonia channel protein AmtB
MSNPINVCVGLFFLWFGWIAFNSGSTYGLTAGKWEYAARAAGKSTIYNFDCSNRNIMVSSFANYL